MSGGRLFTHQDRKSVSEWISMNVPPDVFSLHSTLYSGQAFRWLQVKSREYIGIINNRVWRLQQLNPSVPVAFHSSCMTPSELDTLQSKGRIPSDLISYFRLDVQVHDLFTKWLDRDGVLRDFFSRISSDSGGLNQFRGLRLLDQDPRETIFAFITSANNNVSRISKLLIALSSKFGQKLWADGEVSLYTFPTLEALAQSDLEGQLRELGFGYRAKFIPAAARKLIEAGGDEFLGKLRNMPYEECRDFLVTLPGVGNKVADCICLSGLDKVEVVPVDVHISRAAALRGIHPPSAGANSSPTAYRHISRGLADLWHPFAGWAQVIVFSIHLHRRSGSGKSVQPNATNEKRSSTVTNGSSIKAKESVVSEQKRSRRNI